MTHSFPTRRSSDLPVFRRLGLSHKQTKTTGTLFLSYLRLFLASSRETTSEGSSAYPNHAEFPLFVLYVVCHVVSLDGQTRDTHNLANIAQDRKSTRLNSSH